MEMHIAEIAERIRGLRGMLEISQKEMADVTGFPLEEYCALESGSTDFPFTFLMKCAQRFGVDIIELLTGTNPKLSFYTVVRKGGGLPLERRKGFEYKHLAYLLKDKLAEPFLVTAPYSEEEQGKPMHYSRHAGQEFDYILKGSLRVDFDGHVEILNEGDAALYDSGHPHGMIAANGADCQFLAVVIQGPKEANRGEDNARPSFEVRK
ncbi:MAG: cupin domain-containing protein [Clostridia bacterium]|nr:cupin domain-containing protein [Clostridia bacterium]